MPERRLIPFPRLCSMCARPHRDNCGSDVTVCASQKAPCVFLENVKTLGKRNLDEIVKALNAAQHLVWTPVLEANGFGAARKRERQFTIAVALPADIAAEQTKEDWRMPQ